MRVLLTLIATLFLVGNVSSEINNLLPCRQTLELSPLTDGCGGVEVVDEVLQRVHHVGVHVVEGDGQVAAAVQTLNTVYPSLICYGLKYIDQ